MGRPARSINHVRRTHLSRKLFLSIGLATLAGCGSSTPPPVAPPAKTEVAKVVTVADDAEAVAVVEALTEKLRRNAGGAITHVDLRGTDASDETLVAVGKLASLEQLDLRECGISDAGLEHLTALTKLKALRLSGKEGDCSVSDDGMVAVGKLTSLKVLAIDYLWISEDGLGELAALKELQELYMAETTIADEAIDVMAGFPNLKKLRVARTRIGEAALASLPKLSKLEELDLSECAQISDSAMGPLSEMKSLKKLNLWRVNLSDEGIEPLAGLMNLENLNLDNTRLSDDGLPLLSELTKLTFLHLGSTAISDAGLTHLKNLTALKDLIVTRTGVTQAGVDELKKSLPDTKIQLLYLGGE